MEKKLIKIFAILCCIVTLTIIGNANSVSRSEFEIPFDFIVKNQTFPAGKYSVERLSPASPDLLVLKLIGGTEKAILLRRSRADVKQKNQFQLTFARSDKSYILTGIWTLGEKYAHYLAPDKTGQEPPEGAKSLSYILNPDVNNAI